MRHLEIDFTCEANDRDSEFDKNFKARYETHLEGFFFANLMHISVMTLVLVMCVCVCVCAPSPSRYFSKMCVYVCPFKTETVLSDLKKNLSDETSPLHQFATQLTGGIRIRVTASQFIQNGFLKNPRVTWEDWHALLVAPKASNGLFSRNAYDSTVRALEKYLWIGDVAKIDIVDMGDLGSLAEKMCLTLIRHNILSGDLIIPQTPNLLRVSVPHEIASNGSMMSYNAGSVVENYIKDTQEKIVPRPYLGTTSEAYQILHEFVQVCFLFFSFFFLSLWCTLCAWLDR